MKTSDRLFAVICVAVVLWFCGQKIWRRVENTRWEKERQERIALDFNQTEADVKAFISEYIPDVTDSMMRRWEQDKKLEFIEIDGQKRYFRKAARNLFRLDTACLRIMEPDGYKVKDEDIDNMVNVPAIISDVKRLSAAGFDNPFIVQPRRFRVKYTVTVNAGAVPPGETIRCWLPYPKRDHPRQKDIVLLGSEPGDPVLSPEDAFHSTLYMERPAVKGEPTVFSETFEYTASGEWHPIAPEDVLPYNTATSGYRLYTAERETHIKFTPRLRRLAEDITKGIDNPYLQAKAIFTYINDNYPWASAREYSTIENIPEYVVENGHGDCGQVGLLLITLCRIKGIPARWESGFMLHPHGWNLHDWASLYFEGIGWVPADVSFGIPPYALREAPLTGIWAPNDPSVNIPGTEYFFLGGIDSFRMVVNTDYSAQLYPRKKFTRSETVDFQKGEVEWKGGNLYYPEWDWTMEIEYL